MMRLRARGITLVELMVASALALMILTLVIQLFFPAMRAWSDGQKRSEVGQSLLIASNWIGEDVLRASPGSIKLLTQEVPWPPVKGKPPDIPAKPPLVMKCARGQTSDHTNGFSEFVAYWLEDGSIYRADMTLGDDGAEPATDLASLKLMKGRRRVASNVTAFDVNLPEPWIVELHIEVVREQRKGEIQTAYTSIYAPFDVEIEKVNKGLQKTIP